MILPQSHWKYVVYWIFIVFKTTYVEKLLPNVVTKYFIEVFIKTDYSNCSILRFNMIGLLLASYYKQ